MPYIPNDRRLEMLSIDCPKDRELPLTVGEMNYVVSTLCRYWLTKNGTSYSTINELIGVLECAKLELYRRVASPYEDKKKEENGDVY